MIRGILPSTAVVIALFAELQVTACKWLSERWMSVLNIKGMNSTGSRVLGSNLGVM